MAKKKDSEEEVQKLVDVIPVHEQPVPNDSNEELVEVVLKKHHRINGRAYHGKRVLPKSLAEHLLAMDGQL